jgi:hypothetical protein
MATVKQPSDSPSPERQLESFIAKFMPEIAAQARAIRHKMLARLPGAYELVYDNYGALAIGYVPTERPSDVVFSIVIYPRCINLCFFEGDLLPDPHGRLRGEGSVVRTVRLETPETLDEPAVKALMREAMRLADEKFDRKQPHRLVIRAIAKKQRPRRPDDWIDQSSTKSAAASPAAARRRRG